MRTTAVTFLALLAGVALGVVGTILWRGSAAETPASTKTTTSAQITNAEVTSPAKPEYPPSGTYVFEDADGDAVVSYQLEFDGPNCRFSANGYQTNDDIVCRTVRHSGILDIDFVRDSGEGTTTTYSPGDTLFQLFYDDGKLLTNWTSYQPLHETREAKVAFKSA